MVYGQNLNRLLFLRLKLQPGFTFAACMTPRKSSIFV